jgi:hypothetical protein
MTPGVAGRQGAAQRALRLLDEADAGDLDVLGCGSALRAHRSPPANCSRPSSARPSALTVRDAARQLGLKPSHRIASASSTARSRDARSGPLGAFSTLDDRHRSAPGTSPAARQWSSAAGTPDHPPHAARSTTREPPPDQGRVRQRTCARRPVCAPDPTPLLRPRVPHALVRPSTPRPPPAWPRPRSRHAPEPPPRKPDTDGAAARPDAGAPSRTSHPALPGLHPEPWRVENLLPPGRGAFKTAQLHGSTEVSARIRQ